MGLHAEDHLQPAGLARTSGSRQPPLSGVSLGHRRFQSGKGQARQTLASRGTGWPPLFRLQPVRSRGRNAPLFYRSRRVQYPRTAEQDTTPPSAGAEQRPGIAAVGNAFVRTVSSKRSAALTSTTSPHSAKRSSRLRSSSENSSSSLNSPLGSPSNC